MFTMQTASKLCPLVPYTIRSTAHPLVTAFRGRKYSISPSKSAEMLVYALSQPTLENKVRSLKIAVKEGADINQKINNESILKMVSHYWHYEKDFVPLTETIFSLGAKVDYKEYQEGSPLHDALFFVGSTFKKINAIRIYTKFGVDVNYLNKYRATPLDYAHYFWSNKHCGGLHEIVLALNQRGAVHGYGPYSP